MIEEHEQNVEMLGSCRNAYAREDLQTCSTHEASAKRAVRLGRRTGFLHAAGPHSYGHECAILFTRAFLRDLPKLSLNWTLKLGPLDVALKTAAQPRVTLIANATGDLV